MPLIDEKQLLENLQQGDKKAFSFLFSKYYKDLVYFAVTFTKDPDAAEEIVQDVFVKFWENRHFIHIAVSLKSYLLKATQNKCLDWLKHMRVKNQFKEVAPYISLLSENNTDHYLLYSELQANLDKALNTLPPEVEEAFRLNRFAGLKYHEIADKQQVSLRTVEVRISKALQMLREALKDNLWFFITILN
ncbi:MAG: RNA polymerase sigma-70 factor [Bacteroidales bacterium]|nr:RNA polymerase sigma-70 factor [Bacteroidales bacterium]